MTSRTISPVIRALAPAAALALLLSACGGSDGEGGSSDENQAGASTEEGAEDAANQPSITDAGLLAVACDNTTNVFTLHSPDDGSEITSVTFENSPEPADPPEALDHGRAASPNPTGLSICSKNLIHLSPDEQLLLVSYEEEINGNTVSNFGVLSPENGVTTLSPEQEISDFGTPVNYEHPTYDALNERILYVEYEGDNRRTGAVKAMDLYSGDVSDVGSCEDTCGQLQVLPETGTPVLSDLVGQGKLLESPDGTTLIYADSNSSGLQLGFFGLETVTEDAPALIGTGQAHELTEREVNLQTNGLPVFVDDNTLLIADNSLSVVEFTEETLEEYAGDREQEPVTQWDPLPTAHTLIPESPRVNTYPFVSPDGTEVLFVSKPETGDESWYRVPLDGSAEPEEAFPSPVYGESIIRWQ